MASPPLFLLRWVARSFGLQPDCCLSYFNPPSSLLRRRRRRIQATVMAIQIYEGQALRKSQEEKEEEQDRAMHERAIVQRRPMDWSNDGYMNWHEFRQVHTKFWFKKTHFILLEGKQIEKNQEQSGARVCRPLLLPTRFRL